MSSESFVSSLINIQFWWSQMVLIKWEAYITIVWNLPQHNYNLIFLRGISRCRFHGKEIITQLDLDWNYVFKMLKITTMYMFCIIKRKSHRTWMPRMRRKWKVSFYCRTLLLMQCCSIFILIEAIVIIIWDTLFNMAKHQSQWTPNQKLVELKLAVQTILM